MGKRIYVDKAAYLLTTNTQQRFPYFKEDIFCNILIDVILKCQQLKSFELLAYKINPDHIHLIVQPTKSNVANISQIMHSIKRNSSLHINQILFSFQEENPYVNVKWSERLKVYRDCFERKNNYLPIHEFPAFDWQDSFDDQIARTPEMLKNFINYIQKQATKHHLAENNFLYPSKVLPTDLVFIIIFSW